MKSLIYCISALLILFSVYSVPGYSREESGNSTKVDFKWESVDWAIAYEVEIKDVSGSVVLKRRVKENMIEFRLPPGKYSIRIGVYDRFDKLAAWSDWQRTEIRREERGKKALLNLGIKVSGGKSYIQYLSSWDSPFDNTYHSYAVKIGFNFGEFIIFQPSKKIKYTGFMSHLGMELEGIYTVNTGRELEGQYTIDMTGRYIGGNLFFTTNFNFPLNLIVRAGGGMVKSEFRYHTEPEKTIITSDDPYYKGGVSLELSFLRYFFLEAGADYFLTSYIDFQLKSIRYYGMLGVRI